ncbi:MAG: c-type cytochrome [Rhodopila sp.]
MNGVVGRAWAAWPHYTYSAGLVAGQKTGRVWDEATLDAWLTAPQKMVPNTKMYFGDLHDKQHRDDVVAHLRQFDQSGRKGAVADAASPSASGLRSRPSSQSPWARRQSLDTSGPVQQNPFANLLMFLSGHNPDQLHLGEPARLYTVAVYWLLLAGGVGIALWNVREDPSQRTLKHASVLLMRMLAGAM